MIQTPASEDAGALTVSVTEQKWGTPRKLPREEVRTLYAAGWSSNAIAQKFGARPMSVVNLLKKLGIPRLSASAAQQLSIATGRQEASVRKRLNFNKFEVRGDTTAIFAESKSGERFDVLIDTADLPRLQEHGRRVYVVVRPYGSYARLSVRGTGLVYLHQFILDTFGRSVVPDHRNHNGLDNRRNNLRLRDQAVNGLNRRGPRKGSKSGLRGVSWCSRGNNWRALFHFRGKQYYLGVFEDKYEAAAVVAKRVAEVLSAA